MQYTIVEHHYKNHTVILYCPMWRTGDGEIWKYFHREEDKCRIAFKTKSEAQAYINTHSTVQA